jgi:hypothetical protein
MPVYSVNLQIDLHNRDVSLQIITMSCDLSPPCFYWNIFHCIILRMFTTCILNIYTHPIAVMVSAVSEGACSRKGPEKKKSILH